MNRRTNCASTSPDHDVSTDVATSPPTRDSTAIADGNACLSILGELAGGIAHQISAPIQSVSANLHFLTRAWDSVTGPRPTGEADGTTNNLDAAFVAEEVPRALAQSLESLSQMSALLQTLKEWSTPSDGTFQTIDLRGLIDRVLLVTQHRWRYVLQFELHYIDPLAPLCCQRNALATALTRVVLCVVESLEADGADTLQTVLLHCDQTQEHAVISIAYPANAKSQRMQPAHPLGLAHRLVTQLGGTLTHHTAYRDQTHLQSFAMSLPWSPNPARVQ